MGYSGGSNYANEELDDHLLSALCGHIYRLTSLGLVIKWECCAKKSGTQLYGSQMFQLICK